MNLFMAMFRAGVAMAYESRHSLFSLALKSATKSPKPISYGKNQFAIYRVIRNARPIFMRAVHAPKEQILPLPNLGEVTVVKYVIQRHFAYRAGEHLDLRLLINGRGISFAIPKARMPRLGENLLAVLVPDHIEEYFGFEGEIPNGQMGAGKVEIFASGEADVISCSDSKIVFELPDGPAVGRYVMINTPGAAHHWLLRSFPSTVTVAVKPNVRLLGHRNDSYEDKAIRAYQDGLAMEEKVDGACTGWTIDKEGRIELTGPRTSRRTNGPIRYTPKLPTVVSHLSRAGLILRSGTGELWHEKGPNHVAAVLNSNPTRARLLQETYGPLKLKLFNLDSDKPYSERYDELKAIAKHSGKTVTVVNQFIPKSIETAIAYAHLCRTTEDNVPRDGFVAKDLRLSGTDWWKGKPSDAIDTKIIGFNRGSNRLSESLGSLRVLGPSGRPVNVGTGFTDAQRDWIWNHRVQLEGETIKVSFHDRANTSLKDTGGRFDGFHETKSEVGLMMYAEALADGTDKSPENIKYALKSAAGWRRK